MQSSLLLWVSIPAHDREKWLSGFQSLEGTHESAVDIVLDAKCEHAAVGIGGDG